MYTLAKSSWKITTATRPMAARRSAGWLAARPAGAVFREGAVLSEVAVLFRICSAGFVTIVAVSR
jgi:hypothetical protein